MKTRIPVSEAASQHCERHPDRKEPLCDASLAKWCPGEQRPGFRERERGNQQERGVSRPPLNKLVASYGEPNSDAGTKTIMADVYGKPMDERHTRQILLSRYYLELADQQLRLDQDQSRFAAINMLHEAFETALVCFADALEADVPGAAAIDKIVAAIEKVLGSSVPFRTQIFRFNKIRVNAKHHLVMPDKSDLASYMTIIPEFIGTLTQEVFGVELASVNLSSLIAEQSVKGHVESALVALNANELFECLVQSRRALYLIFEKQFDIAYFATDQTSPSSMLFGGALCRAPAFAKSKRYIDTQVKEPFDMIVVDNATLEGDLIKDGIDTHAFWNITRLTPKVYQRPNGSWINSFDVDFREAQRADCAYVIDTLIKIILQRQARRGSWRMRKSSYRNLQVKPGARVFEKASSNSKVVGFIPNNVYSAMASNATPGLEDDNWFYGIYIFQSPSSLSGYIGIEDTIGEPFETDFATLGGMLNATPPPLLTVPLNDQDTTVRN